MKKYHFKLRDYQEEISGKAWRILLSHKIVYLSMQVRTGKTLTALATINKLIDTKPQNIYNVLFLTKKKAMQSIVDDYNKLGCKFNMETMNYEQLHNYQAPDILDFVICDESQVLSSFPKPNNKHKQLKELLSNHPNCGVIFTTGTPSPESYSQLFHQITVSDNHKWSDYKNFYHWAKDYVNVKQKYVAHGNKVNDYSDADKEKIMQDLAPIMLTYTQEQAGFENTINEEVHKVEMSSVTKGLINKLKEDKVIQGKDHTILADTSVKEMQKVHQLSSGTIKFECGQTKVLDKAKIHYIQRNFAKQKKAIMYVYVAEGEALKESFENCTDSPEEFNSSEEKTFIGQIRSSREGVNLSSADVLIMYNIEFSALSYLQGRDRMTSKERTKDNRVVWLFSDCGIEEKIYKVVKNKENYTTSHYCNKKTNKQTELF